MVSRRFLERLAPEFQLRDRESSPDRAETRYGKEGIKELFDSYMEAFDALRLEPQEFIDAGDQIVVSLHQRVRGKGSGAEVVGRIAHVWTMRGRRRFAAADLWRQGERADGLGSEGSRAGSNRPVDRVSGQQTTAELALGSEFAGYRVEEVAARGGWGSSTAPLRSGSRAWSR